ncbi:hypothetical protein HMPREF9078_01164 [Capnocytophaga sp. oral taxon 380 str. F0488]|nr:hypothetical protein HMPREF9078_01164 [Capnocytophaga sp. oral taxon 380 str. F0488]
MQNYFQSFLLIYEKSILVYGVCIIIDSTLPKFQTLAKLILQKLLK